LTCKKICLIDDRGARFKHPETGQIVHLSPTISIQTQQILGADIIMAFDECTPYPSTRDYAKNRWILHMNGQKDASQNRHS
jgi:queuine tRNA-ribosyltransferase